jgi:hypothetical protein
MATSVKLVFYAKVKWGRYQEESFGETASDELFQQGRTGGSWNPSEVQASEVSFLVNPL